MSQPDSIAFGAVIGKKGINPFVDVPPEVSAFFARRGYVPVAGTLNGVPIQANLVPVGGGRHCLYINGDMRNRAGVDVGDRVEIHLWRDDAPRKRPVPQALVEALGQHPAAQAAYDRLIPSRQQEILAYLHSLKTPAALERNVAKLIARLEGDGE